MGKLVNYMILPEFRLILECCKGPASVDDAIEMKKSELSDVMYNPEYDIIVDFREFKTTLDSTVKDSTVTFFNFLKELNMNSQIAILTTAPHQVVIGMILKELSTGLAPVRMEVFSTPEAAIRFLGIPVGSIGFINSRISELSSIANQ